MHLFPGLLSPREKTHFIHCSFHLSAFSQLNQGVLLQLSDFPLCFMVFLLILEKETQVSGELTVVFSPETRLFTPGTF